ncbi:unnamed protein product [Sphacelaria rigidula]
MFAAEAQLAGDKGGAAHMADQAAATTRESEVMVSLKATVASLETACREKDKKVARLRARSVKVHEDVGTLVETARALAANMFAERDAGICVLTERVRQRDSMMHAALRAHASAAAAKNRAETSAVVATGEMVRLTQELKRQQAVSVEEHANVVELEEKVSRLTAVVEKQVECEAKLQSMQGKHQCLLSQMDKMDVAVENLEEALAISKAEHATTIRAHTRLQEKLLIRDGEREQLQQLSKQLAASTANTESMRAELASAWAAAKLGTAAADEVSRQVKASLEYLRAAQTQIKAREDKISCLEEQVETSASECVALQSQLEGKTRMLSTLKDQVKSQVGSAMATVVEKFQAGLDAVQRNVLAKMESYEARFVGMETRLCNGFRKLATAKFQGKWTRREKREAKARKRAEREAVEAALRPSAKAEAGVEGRGSTIPSLISSSSAFTSIDETHVDGINTAMMAAISKRRRRRRQQQEHI